MRPKATAALLFVAVILNGCGFVSSATCDFAAADQIEALLGEADLETSSLENLEECVFTSVDDPTQQIEIRIETVPDPQIFFEHAIEERVLSQGQTLDLGEGAFLFEDGVIIGRLGDRVAVITSTVPTEELVDVMATTLDLMAQPEAG